MSAGMNETGKITLASGAALEAFRRVKLSGVTAVYAGLGEASIGITEHACASGDEVTIRLTNVPGTRKGVVASAVAAGASLYAAANGMIDDVSTSAGNIIGFALHAGSGANSVIEWVPNGAVSA